MSFFLMNDYWFNNITKLNSNFLPNHIGEIITCNSTKTVHIVCIENKIVKDLMNAFLNWYWFTNIIGQFKQKKL